jgi:hypothetical protein
MLLLYNGSMKTFTHIEHDIPKLQRKTAPSGSRVYETPNGNSYPSVTTVTGLLNQQAIKEWRARVGEKVANEISNRAATRGTRVHQLCEDYLSNKDVSVDMFDHDMWKSFQPILDGIDNVHALETPLYSDHLAVAGTVDCIAEWNGRLSIIDFKTSKRAKTKDQIKNYFMQCSAYAVAFEELTGIPVDTLVILMAVDDEDPIVFVEKRDDYIADFISLREDYSKLYNC